MRTLLPLVAALLLPCVGQAQDVLPVVDDAEFAPLRDQCQRLLKALEALKAPLPADDEKELRGVLQDGGKDAAAGKRLQGLLDRRCLFGVTINPESRVKAARGPLAVPLVRDQPTYVLVKVSNDAGVTAPLKIEGPQLREAGKDNAGRWLEATVLTDAPLAARLSGQKVDYVVVRLIARETGKREATFRFDVGQGTQDLGFRAEVPVLFTVRQPKE